MGKVGTGRDDYRVSPEHRIVYTAEIVRDEMPWLYDRIQALVTNLNAEFQFDIDEIDQITFMKYMEPHLGVGAGHFSWHVDCGYGESARRKISISVALNDAHEFEGGEFCIFYRGPVNLGGRSCGTALSIPSYVSHRVTPVTKGTRYVLVIFVLGPRIR